MIPKPLKFGFLTKVLLLELRDFQLIQSYDHFMYVIIGFVMTTKLRQRKIAQLRSKNKQTLKKFFLLP